MVLGIQIIGLGFGLFMLYLFFIHYKRKDITRLEFVAWLALWLMFISISIWPKAVDTLATTLSFSRTLDFFVFLGVIFVVFMTLYMYLQMRINSRRVEKLVRKLAIKQKKISH